MLWTACHDGDFDKAREAVASGADCDWVNRDFNVKISTSSIDSPDMQTVYVAA